MKISILFDESIAVSCELCDLIKENFEDTPGFLIQISKTKIEVLTFDLFLEKEINELLEKYSDDEGVELKMIVETPLNRREYEYK